MSSVRSNDSSRKRPRRKVLALKVGNRNKSWNDFLIDENDYHVVAGAISLFEKQLEISMEDNFHTMRKIVGIDSNDEERRVCRLRIPLNLNAMNIAILFENCKNLTHLKKVTLSGCYKADMLPPAIGELQSLENLVLSDSTFNTLPREIGNLSNLRELDLCRSKITSLPSSIGRLQNLKILHLAEVELEPSIPDEIWDLTRLRQLILWDSNIEHLSPSIGRLQDLTHLELDGTTELSKLPSEIGDLVSLISLGLGGSGITSLPTSIGRLQNLKRLILTSTKKLKTLPPQIGNLKNLVTLELAGSHITLKPLPGFLGRLKRLVRLNIFSAYGFRSDTEFNDLFHRQEESLFRLSKQCPRLGSFGKIRCDEKLKLYLLRYALACNRARFRTGFGIKDIDSGQLLPKLWPRVLYSATQTYDRWGILEYRQLFGRDEIRSSLLSEEEFSIAKPDAIYQLLVDGRESFIDMLIDRK